MPALDVMMTALDVMATALDDLVSRTEQDLKEEQWERMQNPHLFGGTGGGGYRKVKVGAKTTFYEDGNKIVSFIQGEFFDWTYLKSIKVGKYKKKFKV